MTNGIQLALEVRRAGPSTHGLNSPAATLCPGISPRQIQSIQTEERKEGPVLPAWQAPALGTPLSLPRAPHKGPRLLVLGPVWGKDTQVAVGSCSAQRHMAGLAPVLPEMLPALQTPKISSFCCHRTPGPFHRVCSWSPGAEI